MTSNCLTPDEREELELLRAEKADRFNPDVLLIEGQLDRYSGEYYATGVTTAAGHIYLIEAIENFANYREVLTFQFHVASEPFSFHQLEQELVKTAMGEVRSEFRHAYSDLTGYLWTTEELKVGGHDLLEEINSLTSGFSPAYIALRVERKKRHE